MKIKVYVIDLETSPATRRVIKLAFRFLLPLALVVGVAAAAHATLPHPTFASGDVLHAADLQNNFASLEQSSVPTGAVMAFDLPVCPANWAEMPAARGRTIVGVNPDTSNGLSMRPLDGTFGAETHTLSIAEMPSHNHIDSGHTHEALRGFLDGTGGQKISGPAGDIAHTISANDLLTIQSASANIQAAGGGAAHNNMQPSLGLLYCKKM